MGERNNQHRSYWSIVWQQFSKHRLGKVSFYFLLFIAVVGIYAPFLASSKPIAVKYNGEWFFPLFRYLFFTGFFTKPIDIFYNVLLFTFPFFVLVIMLLPRTLRYALPSLIIIQLVAFGYFWSGVTKDPASDPILNEKRQEALSKPETSPYPIHSWDFELSFMSPYARLNLIIKEMLRKNQHERLTDNSPTFIEEAKRKFAFREIAKIKSRLIANGEEIPPFEKLEQQVFKQRNRRRNQNSNDSPNPLGNRTAEHPARG